MAKRKRPVVLAIASDTHCGSSLGLCPLEGVQLPDGGRYIPSEPQQWVFGNWLDFWDRVAATARRERAVVYGLHLGDTREGDHHGTTQLITADDEAQAYIVTQALEPMRRACAKLWVCKGTEAHVGPGGDDATARWFGAERHPDTEQWAAYEWRLNIHGVRIHARHHANMGGLPWTKHGAAVRLAAQVFAEFADHAARTGTPLAHPHLVLRGHQHRYSDSGGSQPVRAVYAPALQLATSFVHRLSQTTLADVGGLIVTIWPDGQWRLEPVLYTPALSTEVMA